MYTGCSQRAFYCSPLSSIYTGTSTTLSARRLNFTRLANQDIRPYSSYMSYPYTVQSSASRTPAALLLDHRRQTAASSSLLPRLQSYSRYYTPASSIPIPSLPSIGSSRLSYEDIKAKIDECNRIIQQQRQEQVEPQQASLSFYNSDSLSSELAFDDQSSNEEINEDLGDSAKAQAEEDCLRAQSLSAPISSSQEATSNTKEQALKRSKSESELQKKEKNASTKTRIFFLFSSFSPNRPFTWQGHLRYMSSQFSDWVNDTDFVFTQASFALFKKLTHNLLMISIEPKGRENRRNLLREASSLQQQLKKNPKYGYDNAAALFDK